MYSLQALMVLLYYYYSITITIVNKDFKYRKPILNNQLNNQAGLEG